MRLFMEGRTYMFTAGFALANAMGGTSAMPTWWNIGVVVLCLCGTALTVFAATCEGEK